MPQKALGAMKPGEKGKIAKVGGAGVSRRVMDMGLVAGAQVEMERWPRLETRWKSR